MTREELIEKAEEYRDSHNNKELHLYELMADFALSVMAGEIIGDAIDKQLRRNALRLAGKLASAAGTVLDSTPMELSGNLRLLGMALDKYNGCIYSMLGNNDLPIGDER